MTLCVKDLADMLEVMVDEEYREKIPKGGYANRMTGSWDGLKVGLLDPRQWPQNESTVGKDDVFVEQQVSEPVRVNGAQSKWITMITATGRRDRKSIRGA